MAEEDGRRVVRSRTVGVALVALLVGIVLGAAGSRALSPQPSSSELVRAAGDDPDAEVTDPRQLPTDAPNPDPSDSPPQEPPSGSHESPSGAPASQERPSQERPSGSQEPPWGWQERPWHERPSPSQEPPSGSQERPSPERPSPSHESPSPVPPSSSPSQAPSQSSSAATAVIEPAPGSGLPAGRQRWVATLAAEPGWAPSDRFAATVTVVEALDGSWHAEVVAEGLQPAHRHGASVTWDSPFLSGFCIGLSDAAGRWTCTGRIDTQHVPDGARLKFADLGEASGRIWSHGDLRPG